MKMYLLNEEDYLNLLVKAEAWQYSFLPKKVKALKSYSQV